MSDLDLIAYIFCGVAILGVVYTMFVDRRARKRKALNQLAPREACNPMPEAAEA